MIKLCDKNNCTQCYSCGSACPRKSINFVNAGDGFYVPEIDKDLCIECGLCVKSCHIISPNRIRQEPRYTYAAWNKNLNIRKKSSSGGVFTAIAEYVIMHGGVVYGSTMDKLKVKHIRVDKVEELSKLRGSKYLQSNMMGVYESVKRDLKNNQSVFFVGTPCQVSGLYSFLRREYDNLITADLVCHGVPSQELFDKYLNKIGLGIENTREIIFRYLKGWGMQMSRINNKGCHLIISPQKAYYLRAFLKGMMFSKACYNCRYSNTKRVGDLTFADFWEIGTKVEFGYSTRDGVSMLLVNTPKGDDLISGCNDISLVERNFDEAVEGNHNLHSVSIRPMGCENFYTDLDLLTNKEFIKKYNLQPSWKDYLRPAKRYIEELLTGHSK